MKVGSLVFATDQGLGYLAKDFWDHGIITDVMVVRHGRRREHDDWYPGQPRVASFRDKAIFDFSEKMDTMLFFETPFMWNLLPHCRAKGVKTVLMPMHECMPAVWPYLPNVIACPSLLDLKIAIQVAGEPPFATAVNMQVPVPDWVVWKKRSRARTFIHNAGNGGLKGRNGTAELIEAMQYVKSPIELILRHQEKLVIDGTLYGIDDRVEYLAGTIPRKRLYDEGDVFIFPEKFNGLSLPLQEAYAAGMLVMATDRFPMNCWLPNPPLIPVRATRQNKVSGGTQEFEESILTPRDIAATIDEWYDRDISIFSQSGREWAIDNSWEVWGPKWKGILKP